MSDEPQALIIEDDPTFASLLTIMMGERGFQTTMCSTAEDGLAVIKASAPTVVIFDVFLPGMGGVAGIQALKSDWPDLKCVAISGGWGGMSPEETLKAMGKIGADDVLMKPFSSADLDETLERLGLPTG